MCAGARRRGRVRTRTCARSTLPRARAYPRVCAGVQARVCPCARSRMRAGTRRRVRGCVRVRACVRACVRVRGRARLLAMLPLARMP